MSRTTQQKAGRLASRGLLITVIVVAAVGLLNAIGWGAFAQTSRDIAGSAYLNVATSKPETANLPAPYDDAQFNSVELFYDAADAPAAVAMERAAIALPYLVGGLVCLVLILISTNLLRKKPFGIGTVVALFAVALVTVGSGVATPALASGAQVALANSLHLPTNGDHADTWVSPDYPDWTYSDWTMILFGVLIALAGWLALRARRLRMDMEGTI